MGSRSETERDTESLNGVVGRSGSEGTVDCWSTQTGYPLWSPSRPTPSSVFGHLKTRKGRNCKTETIIDMGRSQEGVGGSSWEEVPREWSDFVVTKELEIPTINEGRKRPRTHRVIEPNKRVGTDMESLNKEVT